jgi:hypothetical protein
MRPGGGAPQRQLRAATQAQVAEAFGVIPVSVWRWEGAGCRRARGPGPGLQGPAAALEADPGVVARIRELDGQGLSRAGVAAAAGVSESSVRSVLRPAGAGSRAAGGQAAEEETAGGQQETLPVLPDPVARDAERALARFGLLGEGAAPVFTPGARYPPAGLLLALPALAGTGLLECARDTYGRVRNGFYGLEVMLVVLVFLALLREPRAEGATRVPPAALGRVLGLDRAPEVKTIRRKLAGLAAAGKAADLIMALARHHAAARPAALAFLYADGHARAWFRNPAGAEDARGPAEVPRSGHRGDLGHRRRRRPGVHGYRRAVAVPGRATARPAPAAAPGRGEGRRVTVCSGRGGWSPALFADITGAGSGLLTYRKSPVADLPGSAFTTITCTDDRGRSHEYELADTTITLEITEGPRKGEQVTLRQVSRREPASGGATRQVHTLTSRTDLPAGEVCWRMSSRWREENYFRYARTHSALDALDSYAAVPDDPDRLVPSPAKKAAAARVRRAEAATGAAEASRDASLLDLRRPAPGHAARS